MANYLQNVIDAPVPQSEPLDDRMAQNDAGGYAYPITDEVRMHRFLIMGSEGGSHYQSERTMTLENAEATKRHLAQAGKDAVDHLVQVSLERRAPRVSPILFAMAIAASSDNPETRKYALEMLSKVAATASHLEEFAGYVDSMRGWGRSLRSAVGRWYTERTPEEVAFQAVKYRTRTGWSHRDLLRKVHPDTERDSDLWHVFEWITQGTVPPERESLRIIHSFLEAQAETDPKRMAELVTREDLPREAVPPGMLGHDEVWAALGHRMPPLAFVRNLPALTSHNAIRPMEAGWAVEKIEAMRSILREDGSVRPAPVHPMNILLAMMVYRMGRSIDGKSRWTPVSQVSTALDGAFDRSFSAAPETGQRIYLAVDTSGSMDHFVVGKIRNLTARMAAAAVTMAIARREPNHVIRMFDTEPREIHVTATDSLRDVMERTGALPSGGTDLAQPILDATKNRIPVDCFVIATDGQTWAGGIHPAEALRQYRRKMGIPAKAVQLNFCANSYTVMDPEDAGTLDLPGFDAALPQILHDFMVT